MKKSNLPIPRFYVDSGLANNSIKSVLLKYTGAFFIDRKRFSNYIYKEVLCQYMSTMIEYGVPLLYYPEMSKDEDIHGLKNSFAKVLSETMVDHSVEIALVPVGIDYGKPNPGKETKINFGEVVFLSEFTKTPELLNNVSGVFGSICGD